MLEVTDLHKFYGSFHAVQGISFGVDKGEVVGFLGPNGAGKTTTMKIITGFMAMSAGSVMVDGFDVNLHSFNVRQRIGYLPEDAPSYEDMRVLEYLSFMCEMRGLKGQVRKDRIEYAIGVCALQPKRNAIIKTLSKGYRQRVGLAQAIIHDPELVILDEPTVGLDPNQIIEIRELLREIGERNTVILSSHILSEVDATCSRVIIINDGKIVANSTAQDLVDQHTGSGSYRVVLSGVGSDAEALLLAESSVRQVERFAGGGESVRFLIAASDPMGFPEAVQRLASQNGWLVRGLHHEQPSLEDVFRELTRSMTRPEAIGVMATESEHEGDEESEGVDS